MAIATNIRQISRPSFQSKSTAVQLFQNQRYDRRPARRTFCAHYLRPQNALRFILANRNMTTNKVVLLAAIPVNILFLADTRARGERLIVKFGIIFLIHC